VGEALKAVESGHDADLDTAREKIHQALKILEPGSQATLEIARNKVGEALRAVKAIAPPETLENNQGVEP
jgi:hypothetical protein